MGTRTIIEFIEDSSKIQVYKHWDGYPSSTLADLGKFLAWNGFRNEDLSYTVANFVSYQKISQVIHHLEWIRNERKTDPNYLKGETTVFEKAFQQAHPNVSQFHTGYGIQPRILSDSELNDINAEWFYRVFLGKGNIEIKVYKVTISSIDYVGTIWYNAETKVIEHPTEDLEKLMKND